MRRIKKNEVIDYREAIAEEIPEVARMFWKHLHEDPSCISHAEMQMGVATSWRALIPGGRITWRNHIIALLKDRNCRVWVAQGESEIVGFCVVRIIDGDGGAPMGILNNIFVAAEYRRRGIGLKLLTGGMEWLRRRRIANCCLEPGRNTNMVHELLSRNGFAQVSHTFHSYLTTKPS